MSIQLIKNTAKVLIVIMFLFGIAPRIEAGYSPSELITSEETDRAADIVRIQKMLETKIVKERLEKLGFTENEIRTRLDKLNDQELHQLATQIDTLKTGGDGLGLVIALLVIAILVIVLLKLTGHSVEIKKD